VGSANIAKAKLQSVGKTGKLTARKAAELHYLPAMGVDKVSAMRHRRRLCLGMTPIVNNCSSGENKATSIGMIPQLVQDDVGAAAISTGGS